MENPNLITLELQQAIIKNNPALFDIVAYNHDNKEKYGIILEKLEYGQPLSVIVPLFQKEDNKYTLLTNADNTMIPDSDINSVLDKNKGLHIWKDVIAKTGSNPTMEIEAKLKNFIPKIVSNNLHGSDFSFKKTFDECMMQNQQILSQLSSNVPLEKVFDKIVNEFVNHSVSINLKKKKKNSPPQNINEIQYQKLDLKNQIISILESIDNDNKTDDITFINNFKQRFEKNSITKDDVNNLLLRIKDVSKGLKTSDIINDFVFKKKAEILDSNNLKLSSDIISNPISSSDLVPGDRIGVINSSGYFYGELLNFNNEDIVLKSNDNKEIALPLDESITLYHLFAEQEILQLHLKEKFNQENKLINWDDLSFENQLQLLKGKNTELLTGIDNESGKEIEFKIFLHTVGNDFELKAHPKNTENIDFTNFQFKAKKLTEEEILKLQNNEIIVFEVFDKNGTLQFAHDMKYDRDLNDVVVSPDKGINYARNIKVGKEKGFYAKTTIVNRGKSDSPKIS